MSCISGMYRSCSDQFQSYLQTKIPNLPAKFVDDCAACFAVGGSVSLILSGGNPIISLIGGAVSIVANAVNLYIHNLLQGWKGERLSKNEILFAQVTIGTGCLVGFRAIGLPINIGVSLLISLPFIIYAYSKQ